jgi:hypothetical protein
VKKHQKIEEDYDAEEAARRRDEITKALIKMSPKPHTTAKAKRSKHASHAKGHHTAKSQNKA